MPLEIDILENKVLGREYKRGLEEGKKEGVEKGVEIGRLEGELAVLRRQIAARFGNLPNSLDRRLSDLSLEELENLGVRLMEARSLDDLLN